MQRARRVCALESSSINGKFLDSDMPIINVSYISHEDHGVAAHCTMKQILIEYYSGVGMVMNNK